MQMDKPHSPVVLDTLYQHIMAVLGVQMEKITTGDRTMSEGCTKCGKTLKFTDLVYLLYVKLGGSTPMKHCLDCYEETEQ